MKKSDGGKFFGPVPLGTICDTCTLDSCNISRRPICASTSQLWEVFWCYQCRKKGLVNISIKHRKLAIFHWNENSPIAQMSLQMPPRDVDYGLEP